MVGWESAILSTVRDYRTYNTPGFSSMLDQAVNDIGMTRLQLGVYPGMENPFDSGAGYLNGTISEGVWAQQYLYNSVNDNSDPNVIDPNGFHWTILDWEVDNLVLQIKQRVEARGETLYTYVSYTDYGPSAFEHWRNPAEYAEFMLALFDHMQTKYGFVPNGINVINEPAYRNDWTPAAIGSVIAATGARLAAAGYHPDFLAPSVEDLAQAPQFFDAIIAVPGASQYLKEISYHRYESRAGGRSSLQAIASRAAQYGIRTVMNEWWSSENTYQTLHEDLKIGRNSAWQQSAIGGSNGYSTIDSASGQAVITDKTKFMRQYYKYVRPGAIRIEAAASNPAFDPLAFINRDGKYVAVIKASTAGDFSIANLPSGTYGIFYTTATQFDVQLPDVTLAPGQALNSRIPDTGVITVYAKSPASGSSTTFSLLPRGSVSLTAMDALQPQVALGYARVDGAQSGLAVFGSRSNGVLVWEGTAAMTTPIAAGRIYAGTDVFLRTGLAIANPNSADVVLSFYFTDAQGNDFGNGTTVVPAGRQFAAFLDEQPFFGSSAAKTFTFSASRPVAAVATGGFLNGRREFLMTTFPVSDLSASTNETLVVPYFAAGGGWATQVVLMNPSDTVLTGTLQVFDASGAPAETQSYAIPAHGAVNFLKDSTQAAPRSGSIRAIPGAAAPVPLGLSILSYGGDATAATIPTIQPAAAVEIYTDISPGLRSALAVTNSESRPITVGFDVLGSDGLPIGVTGTLVLPANGQRSLFLDELPGAQFLPSSFRGVLRITPANGMVAAIGFRWRVNERGDLLMSTVLPLPDSAASGSPLFAPLFTGGGYSTQFIMLSGANSTAATISFRSQNGDPISVPIQ